MPRLFPWAHDYLAVYERYGLTGPRTVLAHNVHPTDAELERLAPRRTSIAHCPCSNAALGSGIFPLRRHVDAGVPCALGTDVGGGTGFGMLKEGLQALPDAARGPRRHGARCRRACCYLATRAGAEARRDSPTRSATFCPGKAADFVYLRPPAGQSAGRRLERATARTSRWRRSSRSPAPESVREVRVAGQTCVPGRRADDRSRCGTMRAAMTLAELNASDATRFVAALGCIFEDSPLGRPSAHGSAGRSLGGRSCTRDGRPRWRRRTARSSWRCCARIPTWAHAPA